MFTEVLKDSNVVEVIKETVADDGSNVKLELRALDKKGWSRMMVKLLVDNIEEEEFGLAINKSYWADEKSQKILFCWVVIVWGDLDQAHRDLSPFMAELSQKQTKPAPPSEMSMVTTEEQRRGHTIVDRRPLRGGDGSIKGYATVIRLPHRRPRTGHNGTTKKTSDIGKRGRWGFAQAIGDEGGDPWYT